MLPSSFHALIWIDPSHSTFPALLNPARILRAESSANGLDVGANPELVTTT